MRVLISGVSGFVGSYMTEELLKQGHEVHGFVRKESSLARLAPYLKKIKLYEADLCEKKALAEIIMRLQPDWIVHLAGLSLVSASWKQPELFFQTNISGTLFLLQAVVKLKKKPRFLMVGSSDIYGRVPLSRQPIQEKEPPLPLSPYAVTKACQDLLAYQYFRTYDLYTIRTRSFIHTGPGQNSNYALPNFACQLASIKKKKQKPCLKTGNLLIKRDFTHIKDVVRAYCALLEKGEKGEAYNVCSGQAISLKKTLHILIKEAGIPVKVVQEKARLRPVEIPCLVGDPTKIKKATGWSPKISLQELCKDLLAYWDSIT